MFKSIFISLLKLYVRIGLIFYYRKFQVEKMDKSIHDGSIIFAPTHQNAFMDALAIVMTQPRNSYFLTQAKVFQNKLGNTFFKFIYMLPIYRERDGLHTVKQNKEIFEICTDVLVNGSQPLTIFPEGNHNLKRSIRPLQKGIARIAMSTLDKNPDIDLKICPVGINYSAHRRFRSDIFVYYGKPFSVKPFYKTYLGNNNKGYIELLEELDKHIRPLTIDIPRGLQYHAIAKRWVHNAFGTFNLAYNFRKNQELLNAILKQKPLPKRELSDTPRILKIFFAPFWLFMLINNFMSAKMVRKLTKKLAADPAFESSMELVFGLFLSVFIYMLQAAIVSVLTSYLIGIIYFLSIPVLNFIYLKIYKNSFVVE